MERTIFEDEHIMFRDAVRKFIEKEAVPYHEAWEKEGIVSREFWLKAGQMGLLGMDVPEEFGGGGAPDYRYNAIIQEELAYVGVHGPSLAVHNDIVIPYILHYATDEQKARWLPKICSGECVTAIGMTEPNTGSDLASVRTTAIRKGDHYLVNGQKTFISNGIINDLVIVVAKTNPDERHKGISLLAIESGMAGYERGRNLEKMGLKAQDTAELYFNNVEVPVENLLGEEGKGFIYLMEQLPQERMAIAVWAVAACQAALKMTIQYCQERTAFGQPIGKFQNSRFMLAEMKTETEIAQVFLDRCIQELNQNNLTAEEAAMAKWWTTELQKKIIDQCVQLHGGYGYMMEYPIAKFYLDARVQTIYGGTTEIMKDLIGRKMGF
ncbi:acyl-CoA dehydrogenase family protein [Chloroflexi bacterium TSY]|nr:acyl-CoA dehydrogenase family protein [Chloroflexi bacterium TSY]